MGVANGSPTRFGRTGDPSLMIGRGEQGRRIVSQRDLFERKSDFRVIRVKKRVLRVKQTDVSMSSRSFLWPMVGLAGILNTYISSY